MIISPVLGKSSYDERRKHTLMLMITFILAVVYVMAVLLLPSLLSDEDWCCILMHDSFSRVYGWR